MALFIAAGCSSLSKQANMPKYSETNDSASVFLEKGVSKDGTVTGTKGEQKKRNVKY